MSDFKQLHVGDQHLDVTPPRTRKDNYYKAIQNKFLEIREIALAQKVDLISWSGDMINRKEGHRVPYGLTNWLIDYFGDPVLRDILNVVAMGNHDIHQNARLWHNQPIGTIVKSGLIQPLWTDPTKDNPLGYMRTTIPTKNPDLKLCYHSRLHSYDADKDDEQRLLNYSVDRIKGEEGLDVAITHTHLIPNGHHFIADFSTPADIDRVVRPESRPDLYLCGHVHDDHGVFPGDGYRCVNYGAISRGSIDEYNLQRTVKVALISVGLVKKGHYKVDVESIFLQSARPSEEVFYLEELKETRKKRAAIVSTDFKLTADNIRDTFSIVSPDEAVTMALKAVKAPDRVADRVRGYIDRSREAVK